MAKFWLEICAKNDLFCRRCRCVHLENKRKEIDFTWSCRRSRFKFPLWLFTAPIPLLFKLWQDFEPIFSSFYNVKLSFVVPRTTTALIARSFCGQASQHYFFQLPFLRSVTSGSNQSKCEKWDFNSSAAHIWSN